MISKDEKSIFISTSKKKTRKDKPAVAINMMLDKNRSLIGTKKVVGGTNRWLEGMNYG